MNDASEASTDAASQALSWPFETAEDPPTHPAEETAPAEMFFARCARRIS